MKVPYSWLAEWVRVPWGAVELGERLTMAGIELESIAPAAPAFTGVVVAEILAAERHPQADKLQVCRVTIAQREPLTIVCGAANARAGLKTALAVVGACLPDGLNIKAAKLRGVESFGMLCSAKELGLADTSDGLLELPHEAPVGRPLREYLQLDDAVFDLNVTPNRGDAMSVLGIAREVAALAGSQVGGPQGETVSAASTDRLAVHLDLPAYCPRFAGCVIRSIDNRRPTPIWMRERLRRAGVRSISPLVDVTNYVMLELGQPMHAYDLARVQGEIRVRRAQAGERLTLLDGKAIELQADVLVVADGAGPVGVAGIMGGQRTAVSVATTEVFLEAAFFTPDAVIGRAMRWGLTTDASQRFERGVDPSQQERAMLRAVGLIHSIAGGRAGPIEVHSSQEHLPVRSAVLLRRMRLEKVLGARFEDARVQAALEGLQMRVHSAPEGWLVTAPAHRFDIAIEADLIEEVARIIGYEAIAESDAAATERFRPLPESQPAERELLETLVLRGYQEALTYAFVDPRLQSQLFPGHGGLTLANPIANDLSVMRVSLWPGLLKAALDNQRRQQDRIRLMEHGARFETTNGATREIDTLAGVVLGRRLPEQWGLPRESQAEVDFFDAKGDLTALFSSLSAEAGFAFEAATLSCLHPGRAARILRDAHPIGWLGELHPSLVKELDTVHVPVLFELDMMALTVTRPTYREISRLPQVRRDLAVVVDESVTFGQLLERVTLATSSLLRDLRVFDVYRGPGIEAGRKSIALGLIFQDISRTLTDEDVGRLVTAVITDLRASLNASIRE